MVACPNHYIQLNEGFLSGLQWWLATCTQQNGVSYWFLPAVAHQTVVSDGFGFWGCAKCWHPCLFQLRMLAIPFRPPRDCSQGIASYDCDSCNLGSVLDWTADPMSRGNHAAVNDIHMMHLLGYLFFMETFSLTRTYISGKFNDFSDDLSCDRFLQGSQLA